MKVLTQIAFGIFLACTLCACGKCKPNEHVYDEGAITLEATCTTNGVKTFTCTKCSESYTESTPFVPHVYNEWIGSESEHTKTCTTCDKVVTEKHSFEPTYDTAMHGSVCTVCSYADTEAHTLVNDGHNCKFCEYEKEGALTFPKGYITSAPETIETASFIFKMDKNVYVPGHVVEIANPIAETLEYVSGFSFQADNGYNNGKTKINVSRSLLYTDIFPETEVGAAYANIETNICPGDLFLYSNYTIIHELSHSLQYAQIPLYFCAVLSEGFAEYTSYNALQYIQENYPEISYYCEPAYFIIYNTQVMDYDALYAQPIDYWFTHPFEHAMNGNYAVGFRFMTYLDTVYGDYTSWITTYRSKYPYNGYDTDAPVKNSIAALKDAYGENVLDNFYPWLQENESLFAYAAYDEGNVNAIFDLTDSNAIILYPRFDASGSHVQGTLFSFRIKYHNLYCDLSETRKYLTEYKGHENASFTIQFYDEVNINFYDANGTLLKQESGYEFILDENISYFKLVGEGITNFTINNL